MKENSDSRSRDKSFTKGLQKSVSISKLALLKALEIGDEELFSIAFDAVYNFITELFEEKMYKEVYENVESLAEAFEEINKEHEKFFKAVVELAKLKEGSKNEYTKFMKA